jgi:hypothetical protein
MPLTSLKFKPGINREITSYSNEGGWVDSEKIRFRLGFPEKIGGWVKYSAAVFLFWLGGGGEIKRQVIRGRVH